MAIPNRYRRLDLYNETQFRFPDRQPGMRHVLAEFRFLLSDCYACVSLSHITNLFQAVELMDWFAANTSDGP